MQLHRSNVSFWLSITSLINKKQNKESYNLHHCSLLGFASCHCCFPFSGSSYRFCTFVCYSNTDIAFMQYKPKVCEVQAHKGDSVKVHYRVSWITASSQLPLPTPDKPSYNRKKTHKQCFLPISDYWSQRAKVIVVCILRSLNAFVWTNLRCAVKICYFTILTVGWLLGCLDKILWVWSWRVSFLHLWLRLHIPKRLRRCYYYASLLFN